MSIDPKERVEKLKRANPTRKPDQDPENRVPPGQYLTEKFPVLTHGPTPKVNPERWQFRVYGLVAEDVAWTYKEFLALPQIELTTDFHCVTRWSQLDNTWTGVSITELIKHIGIQRDSQYVMVHAYGGYTTNLPLVDLLSDDVIFAHSRNGEPLSAEHGWPLRLIVPKLYAWKSAKWINGLEFMALDRTGFWEGYGYHNHGDPWTEERFS
jgi:DMSO/TMAO reductase YedYZ molybdopterin-dependent catalytic subunit